MNKIKFVHEFIQEVIRLLMYTVYEQRATKVLTLASVRNKRKQGSWLLWPTVHLVVRLSRFTKYAVCYPTMHSSKSSSAAEAIGAVMVDRLSFSEAKNPQKWLIEFFHHTRCTVFGEAVVGWEQNLWNALTYWFDFPSHEKKNDENPNMTIVNKPFCRDE